MTVRLSANALFVRPRAEGLYGELVMPVLRASVLARSLCRRRARGHVAAVFARSFHIRVGAAFLCVGEPVIGNGPWTLIAELGTPRSPGDPRFHSSRRCKDVDVRDWRGHDAVPTSSIAEKSALAMLRLCSNLSAVIAPDAILIGDVLRFDLAECAIWRQAPWPTLPAQTRVMEICAELGKRIACEAPDDGMAAAIFGGDADIGNFGRSMRRRVVDFEAWLASMLDGSHKRRDVPAALVAGFIGLGPGLTPAGDDFLAGALALLDALVQRSPIELTTDATTRAAICVTNRVADHAAITAIHASLAATVARTCTKLTSPFSACLLRAAARGHFGEALYRIVAAVLAGEIGAAVAVAHSVGQSSGWDMLSGAEVTLRSIAAAAALRPAQPWPRW